MKTLLVDTGFFVALLARGDAHHEWAKAVLASQASGSVRFVTCEAVLAEAFHLVERRGGRRVDLIALLQGLEVAVETVMGFVRTPWNARVFGVMTDYEADFADACVVVLYERLRHEEQGVQTFHSPGGKAILTVDADFFIYRDVEGDVLEVIHPHTHRA